MNEKIPLHVERSQKNIVRAKLKPPPNDMSCLQMLSIKKDAMKGTA